MASDKHEVLQRLKAIELLAYWEGRLVTNRLIEGFGVSRQQASNDIKRYLSDFNPDALVHDPAVKGYVPTPSFSPVLTTGHINEYLELISGLVSEPMAVTLETDSFLTSVQLPDRAVRPEVVRKIIKACRAESSIKILYVSMSNPNWHERVISPHSLVYTGFRWHVRAFCHKRGDFRDFILSRIDRTPQVVTDPAPKASQDEDWATEVTLTLVPNTLLSEAQQALVEKDYGMPDGRLQLKVRKALAHYTLQRYQAAITPGEAEQAMQYPVMLLASERQSLFPYLFGSNS
jgi:predicted DNA-binding transcriptional regulator YafY